MKSGFDLELKIDKQTLKLTNQDKIFWPDEKYTKGDLVEYYLKIAPLMLPYLKDRPQSLNRFPNGINKPGFYQKNMDRKMLPEWVRTNKIFSESTNEYIDYLICNDKATLVFMANLGCIEINPWNSSLKNLEFPDWLVIDLDPEEIAFTEVVKTALEIRRFFEELETECYCKTSGATGLHIYVPMGAKYEYSMVRYFAKWCVESIHNKIPGITSIERHPIKRRKKVYLDYLQNSKGQTLAAPYSVRPRKGASVSTPLEWKEVNAKLDPSKFTMKSIFKRLDAKGDLWKAVLGKGMDIKKITNYELRITNN